MYNRHIETLTIRHLLELGQQLLPALLEELGQLRGLAVGGVGLGVVGEDVGEQLVEVVHEVFDRAVRMVLQLFLNSCSGVVDNQYTLHNYSEHCWETTKHMHT